MEPAYIAALALAALLVVIVAAVWGPVVLGAEKKGASSFVATPPPPSGRGAADDCETADRRSLLWPEARSGEARTASALLAQMGAPWD